MNELLDLPHYVFGDTPTSLKQRKGEVILEGVIYTLVVFIAYYYYSQFEKRMRILEGILQRSNS